MLRWNVVDDRLGTGWTPQNLEGFDGEVREGEEERRRQVAYFGVFDGCVCRKRPFFPSEFVATDLLRGTATAAT